MAKNSIPEFDANPDGNTDIGGIGLTGNDSAGNLVRGFKKFMAIGKTTSDGTTPLDDTFTVRNAADTTKQAKISAANVPAGTTRSLDAEALFRSGAPLETRITASGTHTFAAKTRWYQIEGVGGGGGGGGADGQGIARLAAASGGGSGFFGKTGIIHLSPVTSGAVVIGAAGAAGGAGGGDGGNGGDTTWTDASITLTFGGGKGGKGATGDTGTAGLAIYPARATSSVVGSVVLTGGAAHNTAGLITSPPSGSSAPGVAKGGCGAESPYGTGGSGGATAVGSDATDYGAGGGGAGVTEVSTNFAGGAGGPGLIIVREW